MLKIEMEKFKWNFREEVLAEDLMKFGMPTSLMKLGNVGGDLTKLEEEDMQSYFKFIIKFLTQMEDKHFDFKSIPATVLFKCMSNPKIANILKSLFPKEE